MPVQADHVHPEAFDEMKNANAVAALIPATFSYWLSHSLRQWQMF